MKILVTGATGFVGKSIVEELIKNSGLNWEVYSTGTRELTENEELPGYTRLDITNIESFENSVDINKLDVLVHSAGLAHQFQGASREDFYKVNVAGTKNVLRFAKEKSIKHFVLISSVSVYGSNEKKETNNKSPVKINEETKCSPQNEYAQSKLEAESEAVRFCRENKMALTILRLATVIGEGDAGNVSRLIAAIANRRFLMVGKGENFKTLIYKKDVARACRMIIEKKEVDLRSIEIFNVAAEPVPMNFIVESISQSLGRKPTGIFLPIGFLKIPLKILAQLPLEKIKSLNETLKKWASEEAFSNERIFQKYHFKPETSVTEALKRQVEFYIQQK